MSIFATCIFSGIYSRRLKHKYFKLASLARRVADPLRPQPCEVANSVGVFRELSWLTGGMAKVEWGSQGCGAEVSPPAKTPHSHRANSHHK